MRNIAKIIVTMFLMFLFILPSSASADGDYEAGDGWIYQDGTLTITENGGLKDFVINEQDPITEKWTHEHSVSDVSTLRIGENVTYLTFEVYDCNVLSPSSVTIEPGNAYFVIDDGWVVNKETNTLFSATNLANRESVEVIENIPEYIEHIGARAFYDYKYTTQVTIPKNVVSIGDFAFDSCSSLQSVSFPSGLQSIGARAFYGCKSLAKVHLGPEVNYIGVNAFGWCPALSSFDIRETDITVLCGDSIGAGDRLKAIVFPETLKHIEARALNICSGLETIVIHSSDVVVENNAFRFCDNLKQCIFTAGKPSAWGNCLFEEIGPAPNGSGYISGSHDRNGEIFPYPTLYYTAAYADEWAPNGETEWNSYQIQQISQEELDAILAEARGEAIPESTATPTPTAAATTVPEPTAAAQETDEPNQASSSTPEILLLAVIAAITVGIVVMLVLQKQKSKK
jgi:hypothetical protein